MHYLLPAKPSVQRRGQQTVKRHTRETFLNLMYPAVPFSSPDDPPVSCPPASSCHPPSSPETTEAVLEEISLLVQSALMAEHKAGSIPSSCQVIGLDHVGQSLPASTEQPPKMTARLAPFSLQLDIEGIKYQVRPPGPNHLESDLPLIPKAKVSTEEARRHLKDLMEERKVSTEEARRHLKDLMDERKVSTEEARRHLKDLMDDRKVSTEEARRHLKDLRDERKDLMDERKVSTEEARRHLEDLMDERKVSTEEARRHLEDLMDERKVSTEEARHHLKDLMDERKVSTEEARRHLKDLMDERKVSTEEARRHLKGLMDERKVSTEEARRHLKGLMDERKVSTEARRHLKDLMEERKVSTEEARRHLEDLMDERKVSTEEARRPLKDLMDERGPDGGEKVSTEEARRHLKDLMDERKLSTEQAVLQESLHKESTENEELMWKLHNGDLSRPRKVSPTSPSPARCPPPPPQGVPHLPRKGQRHLEADLGYSKMYILKQQRAESCPPPAEGCIASATSTLTSSTPVMDEELERAMLNLCPSKLH
ncbi:hypothetical protein KUCAC02_035049 [Chaenocephalus aceratus]|nr:hypothetical protein KUCAC02_035049 [Chaenocephalus aceratus]